MRGLKHAKGILNRLGTRSHPIRVRGLKLCAEVQAKIHVEVAPYTGAWIETHVALIKNANTLVAPYTGAWIETYFSHDLLQPLLRRTLYGCVD